MPNVCRMKDPDDVFLIRRPPNFIRPPQLRFGLKGSIGFGTYTISILPSRRSRFSFVCRAGLQASSHLAIAVHVQVFLGEAYED
ncbi:hypothetical protein PGT21_001773 [Puccinia graminis f. sp. tritici]|uniref:Uncharacterized protein n=1 Tax=Puccinia graminis f. sp. tritici TaxID=56615 RepID=A0A5B0N1J0_PUCGR|nr:hypothetical protein PGT21_001773 [Puccinia graminis f. sp. tritici]KAA1118295.1 hypothetical protein PGTUg99_003320 [Puccinia graminis f. sp. tritici]